MNISYKLIILFFKFSLTPDSVPKPVENHIDMAFATPAPGSSKPTRSDANVPLKSTCLFCSHPVRVTNQATDPEAAVEWNRLIKTLCYHMQLESKEVPKNCTTTAFPLCTLCKHYAVKLLDSQNKIDEAQKIISKTITTIERTVADAEILNVSVQTGSVSRDGKKLRDTILEGTFCVIVCKYFVWNARNEYFNSLSI